MLDRRDSNFPTLLVGSAETPRGNSMFGVARLPNGSCIVLLQVFVRGGGDVGPSAIWLLSNRICGRL